MKRNYFVLLIGTLAVAGFLSSCKNPVDINEPSTGLSSSNQNFMQIAEKSSSVNSFTPNYNEEQAMTIAGAMYKDLYPIRVGQKMTLTDKSLTLVKDSTTATGTYVQKFNGDLVIQGSFQKPTMGINSKVDTTIHKSFTTTITRMIQFVKVSNTGNDTLDWKVNTVSLPNGGTGGGNILITKLSLTSQDGTEVTIDNPNTYFFKAGKEKPEDKDSDDNDNHNTMLSIAAGGNGWKDLLTWYHGRQQVKLTVQVLSTDPDPDFLTVTYGASMNGSFRTKERFDLVSTVQEGTMYRKTYTRDWLADSHATRMHAVINAYPRNVVYTTDAQVEVSTWGVPYRVK
jgi:hypothetical protein